MTINERMSLPIWKKLILYSISFIIFLIQFSFVILGFVVIFNVSNPERFAAFRYLYYIIGLMLELIIIM